MCHTTFRFGAVLAGAGLLLTGCSTATVQAAQPAPAGIELVIGVHANEPAPDVTQTIGERIRSAIASGQPIGAITVEGTPRVLQETAVIPLGANNQNKRDALATHYAKGMVAAIQRAKPVTAGANLLAALVSAADAARTASPRIRDIVVVDNGLSDRAPLDFTRPGATEASGDDVAKQLLKSHELEATTFAGMHVEFVGLASAVAPPQPALAQPQVTAISSVYRSIVEAGGGTASITPVPRTGSPVSTALPVKVVKPQPTAISFGGTQRFGDGSAVAFTPGSPTFRDPRAARALLEPLADWLQQGTHSAVIVGTTSSEGHAMKESDLKLSTARAVAVKSMLVSLGADAGRIRAIGKGYIADPPDRVHGVLDPAKAALNRVVRITTRF